jgi:hypothetical protein
MIFSRCLTCKGTRKAKNRPIRFGLQGLFFLLQRAVGIRLSEWRHRPDSVGIPRVSLMAHATTRNWRNVYITFVPMYPLAIMHGWMMAAREAQRKPVAPRIEEKDSAARA